MQTAQRRDLEYKAAAVLELRRRKQERANKENTVYGLVCPDKGLVRCHQESNGRMVEVDKEPTVQIPLRLERAILTKAPIIILKGGRGSGKSESVSAIFAARMKDRGAKVGCFREIQNSIAESVHSILEKKINEGGYKGFKVLDGKIDHENGGKARYRGLARNPEAMKSMDGFDDFWVEEAQTMSGKSIELIEPTLRKDGSQIWYTLNPASSADPLYSEHIKPYESQLLANDGIYEDENILIIEINYTDNPWFPENLEKKRVENKVRWSKAKYDHVWEGHTNDEVENSIILAEWFDACINAHEKLGFKGVGARFSAHDPSDTGPDDKSFVSCHGAIVDVLEEMSTGNVNEGADWACGLAIKSNTDYFTWDGDGMGIALSRDISTSFNNKPTKITMFRGSEAPDNPEAIYNPVDKADIIGQKRNKDVFKNKRAQYYQELRDRCYRTYLAVEKGEYHDPETLISFDGSLKLIKKLRAELCRMPIKPNRNGLVELYTKEEMKRLFNLASPNIADGVMMLMRRITPQKRPVMMPQPIRPMGRR